RAALAGGNQVWTITRGQRELPAGVEPLIADRNDTAAMEEVISGQNITWDLIVDCICYDLPQMQQDIILFRERARQFVFVSTDFVYDPAQRKFPQPEETEFYVADGGGSYSYGYKKRLCEEELIQSDTGSMQWSIVRPCHIYGPTSLLGCLPMHGRDPDLIKKLRAGEALKLVGGGHFLQQPILADDLGKLIIGMAGNQQAFGKIFNTAGPDIIESWQYYQMIAEVLGVKLKVEEVPVAPYLAANPGHGPFMCHRIYDLQTLKDCGLEVPSTPIEKGLRMHVEGLVARE
ncbi:MAG: NAD-dependent epimerase/dehydratase family protein, partial [Planctomycetes bacterium]|nr:NAD-dependent epimerase/dehydratase family protein [Planctomycetota bacterium]